MGRSVEYLEIVSVVGGGELSPRSSSSEWGFRELDDVFLQTQTRIWLGEMLHRRFDEHLNVIDILADGELLFEVSRVVWKMLLTKPMELEHIKPYKYEPFTSRKSGGRYMPYSNVDSFLKLQTLELDNPKLIQLCDDFSNPKHPSFNAKVLCSFCQNHSTIFLKICKILGLTGVDLFSPSDVVEKKDTRKVCICIRTLAKRARLKQLNVPDFDMVTCTVAMPTDMVGCIRRSLELGIGGCNSYQYGRIKGRQRSSVASSARYCDSFSDDSDDADSNLTIQSDSSSTHGSHYALSQINYDLECSPEISSDHKRSYLQQNPLELEQEKHEYAPYQFESKSLSESTGSLCSELVECDNQLDSLSSPSSTVSQIHLTDKFSLPKNGTLKYILENDSLDFNCASDVEDFMDHSVPERSYMVDQLEISKVICYGIDISNPNLFDGESIFESYTRTDSDRSTASTFANGFENEHSDVNDVELSSTSSMSSVSGALLNLNFDDQVGEEDGFKTLQFPKSRNQVVVFPTQISQLCSHYPSCSNNSRSYDSHICMPQADLKAVFGGGIICKIEMNASENVHCDQLDQEGKWAVATNRNGCHVSSSECRLPSGLPDECVHAGGALKYVVTNPHPTSNNCAQAEERIDYPETRSIATGRDISQTVTHVHRSSLSRHLTEPMPVLHSCMTTKCSEDTRENGHLVYTNDEEDLFTAETVDKRHSRGDRKNENIDTLIIENSNKKVDHRVEQANRNPKRWSMLKSVAGGTAVVGMVFLLLGYRKNGRDKKGDNSMQSNQMQKTNCGSFSSQKEQKGQVNGVYPAEKLKL